MRIILDITRLLLRRGNATPTGIDRVELAYLARLLDNPQYPDVHFVVTTHIACGIVSRAVVRRLLNEVSQTWILHPEDGPSSHFAALVEMLQAPVDLNRATAARFGDRSSDSWSAVQHTKLVALALRGYATLWRLLLEARRISTCYMHVSHVCLEHRYIFNWTRGGHIRPVFFLHDTIPLDFPEYCGDNAYRKHLARVRTAAAIGRSLVVNSQYTKERLVDFFQKEAAPELPIIVSPLGSELGPFARQETFSLEIPYFIHVGTIEARKNIALLFNVWREIIANDDAGRIPRLVLAGRRGWKSQSVFDALDRSRELAPYVIEASGLNDAELETLIANSAGVLTPSFVEGFGLTGAEALVRGIPVVASDIAAHREVLGDAAIFVNPIDGLGWVEAIRSLAWSQEFRRQRVEAAQRYKGSSWPDHVDSTLGQVIVELGSGTG